MSHFLHITERWLLYPVFLSIIFWFPYVPDRVCSGVQLHPIECAYPALATYAAHKYEHLHFAEAAPSLEMQQCTLETPLYCSDQCCNDALWNTLWTMLQWCNCVELNVVCWPPGLWLHLVPLMRTSCGLPSSPHNWVHSAKRPAHPNSLSVLAKGEPARLLSQKTIFLYSQQAGLIYLWYAFLDKSSWSWWFTPWWLIWFSLVLYKVLFLQFTFK